MKWTNFSIWLCSWVRPPRLTRITLNLAGRRGSWILQYSPICLTILIWFSITTSVIWITLRCLSWSSHIHCCPRFLLKSIEASHWIQMTMEIAPLFGIHSLKIGWILEIANTGDFPLGNTDLPFTEIYAQNFSNLSQLAHQNPI